MYCLQKLTLHGGTNIQIQHLKRWTQNHSGLTHQRATKLPVLYHATGHVYDISIPDSFMYTYYGICS